MTTTDNRPDTVTSTRPEQLSAADAERPAPAPGVTVARVLHSELIKLRSVRSTYYALGATAVSLIGIGAFAAFGAIMQNPAPGAADPPVAHYPGSTRLPTSSPPWACSS